MINSFFFSISSVFLPSVEKVRLFSGARTGTFYFTGRRNSQFNNIKNLHRFWRPLVLALHWTLRQQTDFIQNTWCVFSNMEVWNNAHRTNLWDPCPKRKNGKIPKQRTAKRDSVGNLYQHHGSISAPLLHAGKQWTSTSRRQSASILLWEKRQRNRDTAHVCLFLFFEIAFLIKYTCEGEGAVSAAARCRVQE